MSEREPQFIEVASGDGPRRRIAWLEDKGRDDGRPGLVWLQGFKSEMTSTKATALSQWARADGLTLTRFDYSGHGRSGGRFEDGTLSHWLEEAHAVLTTCTRGPQVLIGSSMGGFVSLLLARWLQEQGEGARIAGIALIAPAWDMVSELLWPRLSAEAKTAIERDGVWLRPSRYGDGPYPITRALVEDGRRHQLKGMGFDPRCPVRILHGMDDPDVPWQHSLSLLAELAARDVRLTLIKDGEHRLSRESDLELLRETVWGLVRPVV